MRWDIIILIPVIALVVLILASVFRGDADKRRIRRPPPEEEDTPEPARAPEDTASIDRFLQEIQARQRAREAERSAPVMVAIPVTPAEAPPPEMVKPMPRPPIRATWTEPPPVRTTIVPTAMPVEVAVAAVVVEPEPPPPLRPVPRAIPSSRADLVALLRSSSGLRTAVLLREILDPPLCRRPRRLL
jgi:hypothetical protein